MRILTKRFLAAGNLYADRPVVCLKLGEDGDTTSRDWTSAWRRIVVALPEFGSRGDELLFLPHLRDPALLPEVGGPACCVETLALVLQRSVHWPVCFARGNSGDADEAVFEATLAGVGYAAGRIAVEIINHAIGVADDRLLRKRAVEGFAKFRAKAMTVTPALSAMLVARAANECGIPWFIVPRTRMLQLGQGPYQQRIRDSFTSRTGVLANKLASNKATTFAILRSAGIPVSDQLVARSAEGAIRAARRIGFPVAVKPKRGSKGDGVTVNVATQAKVTAAFQLATRDSGSVVIEAMTAGDEYRLLVVGGRFVAASCRRPAKVLGDGRSSIRKLIEEENRNPDRAAAGLVSFLSPLKMDEVTRNVIASQGHTLESIPGAGDVVWLRRISNVSQGGTAEDCTADIHPANRRMAERAAAAIGLDLCGVDFITPDPKRPYWEVGGAVCEVNSRPGLRLHSGVMRGTRRPVEIDVVEMLFRKRPEGRIPIVVILSQAGDTAIAFSVAAMFATAGLAAGVWAKGSLYVGDKVPVARIDGALDGANALVRDATLSAAVLQIEPAAVREQGLGLDRIDVLFVEPGTAADADVATALSRMTTGIVLRSSDALAMQSAARALNLPLAEAAPL
jgi:cyanophycin synthetase